MGQFFLILKDDGVLISWASPLVITRSRSLLYTTWCGSGGHASILYIHLIVALVVVDKSSSLKSELLASEATFTGRILTGNPL